MDELEIHNRLEEKSIERQWATSVPEAVMDQHFSTACVSSFLYVLPHDSVFPCILAHML